MTLGDESGHIHSSLGDRRLATVGNVLTSSLEAPDDARIAQLQDVVGRHLFRFALREALQVGCQSAE